MTTDRENSPATIEFWRRDALLRDLFSGLLRTLKPDVLCDVGSLDGSEAIKFRSLLPEAKVFAFEANPWNFKAHFAPTRTDLADIRCENLAICDQDGDVVLHALTGARSDGQFDWRSGASSLRKRLDGVETKPVVVRGRTLDSYFSEHLAAGQTFGLWIDAESAMDRIIAGAAEVLAQTIILRCEVEHIQYWQDQSLICEIESALAYIGFITIGGNYVEQHTGQSDIVCLNSRWCDLALKRSVN